MDQRTAPDTLLTGLVVSAAALLLEALGFAGFGLWFVLSDLESHTDEFDGLGVAIGLVVAVPALVGAALAAATLLTARRPSRVRGALGVLTGAVAVILGLPAMWITDDVSSLFGLVVIATGVVLLICGIGLARRRPSIT